MNFSITLTSVAVLLLLHSTHAASILSGTVTPPTVTVEAQAPDKVVHGGTNPPPTLGTIPGNRKPDDVAVLISPSPSPDPYDPSGAMCDIWNQDCPAGFKCVSEDLGSDPRCRPLDNSPDTVGDECSTKNENDGDTCEEGAMCINGICEELCHGSPASPICFDADECHIYADGTPLCEDECDPYIYNVCDDGKYCSQDSTSPYEKFTCMIRPEFDPSDPMPLGMSGKSCVETSQCEQGFACISKTQLPNGFCHNGATLKCCTPLAEDPNDCPNGMTLFDYYDYPPPSFEHVKFCALFGN